MRYLKTLLSVRRKPEIVEPPPYHVRVEPIASPLHLLALEAFGRILREVKPRKLSLAGDKDPFGHPGVLAMVHEAKTGGIAVSAGTAAVRPPQEADRIVAVKADVLAIGWGDQDEPTEEGLEALEAAKTKARQNSPVVCFHYRLTEARVARILESIRRAAELGVFEVYFHFCGDGNVDRDVLEPALGEAYLEAMKTDVITNAGQRLKDLSRPEGKKPRCILPWMSTTVAATGDVYPCGRLAAGGFGSLGNALQEPFAGIWNGEKYRAVRRAIARGDVLDESCRGCPHVTLSDVLSLRRLEPF